MSEEEVGQGVQEPDNSQGEGTGINPAWNDLLGLIPEELHSQVTPHLSKWDQGVQQRFQTVQSEYEPYKPFVEQKVNPEDINYGLGLINAIQTNPQEVMDALTEWMGADDSANPHNDKAQSNQGQGDQQQELTPQQQFDLSANPEYKQLNDTVNQMAQIMVTQRQAQEQQQADDLLASDFSRLEEQNGQPFSEPETKFLITQMLTGASPDDAYQAYQEVTNQILTNQRRPAPQVLGGGGSFPNPSVDPSKMNSKDTRSMVEQMLNQAAQQR